MLIVEKEKKQQGNGPWPSAILSILSTQLSKYINLTYVLYFSNSQFGIGTFFDTIIY